MFINIKIKSYSLLNFFINYKYLILYDKLLIKQSALIEYLL